MFQDLALFPHMDVFGNISFGLRMQGLKPSEIKTRVENLLNLVEMSNYGNRKVHELSGGERQRVALARSLAPEPKLLMLDEPLASLDRALRETLQGQVRNILKKMGLTSLYVTHDRDEAFSMADRLVFMNQGRIIQIGTPEEVFYNPANEFVARSLGFKNILRGAIINSKNNILEISSPLGTLHASTKDDTSIAHGSEVMFLVDEREISIHNLDCSHEPNSTQLDGVVTEKIFRAAVYELQILIGDSEISLLSSPTPGLSSVQAGDRITVDIKPTAIRLLSS
jgi:ABC-type Fe3+/spermidine/putrescine transport system ATPase subunit